MAFLPSLGFLGFEIHIFYCNTPCLVWLPIQHRRKPISREPDFSIQKQGFMDGFLAACRTPGQNRDMDTWRSLIETCTLFWKPARPWCEPGRWGRKPAHRSANAHVSRVRVDLHGANDHGPCARIHVDEHASTNLVTHARR